MIVQAVEMAKAVRVAIDMNVANEQLLITDDNDTLSLDEIILAKLTDAVRIVEMEAPATMLESGHDFGGVTVDDATEQTSSSSTEDSPDNNRDNVFWTTGGKGFIILPNDFMRLVAFRMSDWKRTVFEAISENDPQYALQSSKWKGICGNPEKPVCAIVRRSEGKVLEFYSCSDETATVVQATYVPIPKIDIDGGIDIPEDCYRAVVYRAASLALASIGETQLSTTMLEISKSLLQ